MVVRSQGWAFACALLLWGGSSTCLAQVGDGRPPVSGGVCNRSTSRGDAFPIGSQCDKERNYAVDETGRRFRVRFDPGNELRLGVMGGVWREAGVTHSDPAVTGGLALRGGTRTGLKHEDVTWTLEHRLLWSTVRPWGGQVAGIPIGETTLYRGTYTRHTDEPFLMLPSNPPKRLYFPFDIGVEAETGRARLQSSDSWGGERLRLVVARGMVLLDPWRSGRRGNAVQFGIGIRYDLELAGSPGLDDPVVTHRLAPFTETTLRVRWEDEQGRTAVRGCATYFPHWDTDGEWYSESIESRLEVERVIIALNDVPVSVAVDTGFERWPEPGSKDVRTEVRALAGLKVGWQLR